MPFAGHGLQQVLCRCHFIEWNGKCCGRKQKKYLFKPLQKKKDLYACGIMIEAAQILFSKKWISSTAVENMEPEKIEKARQSAIRFLSKC